MMKFREARKKCMVYPEDKFINIWDPFISLLLIASCIITPYHIAFSQDDLNWKIALIIIDLLFLSDIFITFNLAFYDEDFYLSEDRCEIAYNYLRSGWLIIDVIAIIPFEYIGGASIHSEGHENHNSNDGNLN